MTALTFAYPVSTEIEEEEDESDWRWARGRSSVTGY